MNLLTGAKQSARLVFSSPSSTRRLFHLHPVAALQHCNFYSTKAASTIQKTQKATKPRTQQKASEKSFSFAQTIKKQAEAPPALWPKPQPISYQAEVANNVNFIGNVDIPVKFVTDSDGKHFTVTVISLRRGDGRGSLSIPVVFEGDLAHVAACHVKENDCVFVSGQLSGDPLRCALSESLGKFHVVAESVNFVEEFEKSDLDSKLGISSPAVDINGLGRVKSKNVDHVDYNQISQVEFDGAKERSSSIERPAVPLYEAETVPQQVVAVDNGNVDFSSKGWEGASTKKDANQILDLWGDLLKQPLQWWDYRSHKAKGLVKEKFPDFKKKETGESLWISSAPKWILPSLGKMEFDVKEMKAEKKVYGGEGHSDRKQNPDLENSWKNLVENPGKWWDNRAGKKNSKAPDFRHKETGEVLWLNSSPEWVLSKLPPVRGGQNTA
ncbi:protein OSB2, chloroplastic-like [Salvia miltiorrhiza]|uniref:protein OSB2, chloroplastic-like n=1 Tax=Salvia miltiorrhiza TaxID=226208 RepID=UPI0025ACBE55|nr:protein OSB2, chloroplastic-like [Salvia miltiorrhiza]